MLFERKKVIHAWIHFHFGCTTTWKCEKKSHRLTLKRGFEPSTRAPYKCPYNHLANLSIMVEGFAPASKSTNLYFCFVWTLAHMHITHSFKLLCLSVAGQRLRKRGVGEALLRLIKTHYWSRSVWVWVGVWRSAEPRAHLSEDSSSVLYSRLARDPSGGHIKEFCSPATLVFWRQQRLMTSLPLLFHSWTVRLMWSTIPQYVENGRWRKNLLNLSISVIQHSQNSHWVIWKCWVSVYPCFWILLCILMYLCTCSLRFLVCF